MIAEYGLGKPWRNVKLSDDQPLAGDEDSNVENDRAFAA